jgi:hypothetical protein
MPSFQIEECEIKQVKELVERFHGYGKMGTATLCFRVVEKGETVAAFSWLPPPPGAAKSVCPEFPAAVLSLSRMVAVPKSQRQLKHISKPLKFQMKHMIDRTRWPVLLTWSDTTLGHDGYVYKCSGWKKTKRSEKVELLDELGRRTSGYSNGSTRKAQTLRKGREGFNQRWEHWVCSPGEVKDFMEKNGWKRVPVPGKFYKSGNPAYRIVNERRQQ